MSQINRRVEAEINAFCPQNVQTAVDNGLVQFEIGYAVTQQSTRILVTLEHSYGIPLQVQLVGGYKSGWSGTYHGYTPPVASGVMDAHVVFLKGMFRNGSFILPVGRGLVLYQVQDTGFLT